MEPLDELALLLRPAGGGIHLVSTGLAEQRATQRRLYRAATDAEIDARFRERLARIPEARAVVLGVPSDVGAGFRRGANLGPQALREAMLEGPAEPGALDLGDVFVVPQLLHDDMLSDAQKRASHRALYPGEPGPLPVSPLSIEERALDLILSQNPGVTPVILGGDHSVAWPAVAALARARAEPWGIVQIDAHTDLLEERLGVRHCFATWAFHANDLVGRGGRLVQVGIRASARSRQHWQGSLGVKQLWADHVHANPEAALDEVIEHLRSVGVSGVYVSNDIDGTDPRHAPSTGTPEPGGLDPDWVVALIRRLGREIGVIGGDVVEVAPTLGPTEEEAARTVGVGARYVREVIAAVRVG